MKVTLDNLRKFIEKELKKTKEHKIDFDIFLDDYHARIKFSAHRKNEVCVCQL